MFIIVRFGHGLTCFCFFDIKGEVMFEYEILGAGNIEPNVLRACGAVFCVYWGCWVIYADNKREAVEALNNVNVFCCQVKKLGGK